MSKSAIISRPLRFILVPFGGARPIVWEPEAYTIYLFKVDQTSSSSYNRKKHECISVKVIQSVLYLLQFYYF